MANSHPYISGPGNIVKMIAQLRKSFPAIVDSKTVKKLGFAPNNESFLISVLQFIGVIDSEGKKIDKGAKVLNFHKDEEFSKEFSELVKTAYSSLFELHGDQAWKLSPDELITFFRHNDQTGEAVGKMQANTFRTLSSLSGHVELAEPKLQDKSKNNSTVKTKVQAKNKRGSGKDAMSGDGIVIPTKNDFGLSVRIEINLPASGTKETYDSIFKSIRENLLNG